MAAIAATSAKQNGDFLVTTTTLGASDTLTYLDGTKQLLVLANPTGGNITVTIDGDGGTTITPPGFGGTVSVSSGKSITVNAGTTKAVRLDTISAFLQGTVAVTGGSGLVASLYAL